MTTPTQCLEQLLRASASRPVLQRRGPGQTALESAEEDDASLVEAAGHVEVLAPREPGSNNPWRSHRSPTVEENDDDALPSLSIREAQNNAAQAENGQVPTPFSQQDVSAQNIEVAQQRYATDPASSAEVEQWLAASRIVLSDPSNGAQRLRAIADALTSHDSDEISRLIDAIPMLPRSSSALKQQLARLSAVIANHVSPDSVMDAGSSAQNRPKRQARVNNLRAAAESWRPQTIASDSSMKPHADPFGSNGQMPSGSSSNLSPMSAKAAGKRREVRESEQACGARDRHDKDVPDPLTVQPRRRKPTEAQCKHEMSQGRPQENGSDVYSRLAAPTSAWKAKQKPAVQAKQSVSAADNSLTGSINGNVKTGQERRSRSSSTSSTHDQVDVHRRSVGKEMEHLRLQLDAGTSNTNKFNHQQLGANHVRVFSATVVGPVAAQRPREPTGHVRQQPTRVHAPFMNGTHNKQKVAVAPRYARPDPFAPKSDPTTRNIRPTYTERHLQPRSVPMPPARPDRQAQSNVRLRPRLVESRHSAHAPIWERLAQQQTSSSTAKNKRRALYVKANGTDEGALIPRSPRKSVTKADQGDTDAEHNAQLQDVTNASNLATRKQVTEPPRREVPSQDQRCTPGPSSRGQEDSRQDSVAVARSASAPQSKERSLNVPTEPRRTPPAVPVASAGPSSATKRRSESMCSASGILFTSRNDMDEARPDVTPKDAVPIVAECVGVTRRDEIAMAPESSSPEADTQRALEAGKARKHSVFMSSVKSAMSALKKFPSKMAGIRDSARTARRESAKQTRRRSSGHWKEKALLIWRTRQMGRAAL